MHRESTSRSSLLYPPKKSLWEEVHSAGGRKRCPEWHSKPCSWYQDTPPTFLLRERKTGLQLIRHRVQPASNMVMTVTNGRNSRARLWTTTSYKTKETYFPLTCQVMNFKWYQREKFIPRHKKFTLIQHRTIPKYEKLTLVVNDYIYITFLSINLYINVTRLTYGKRIYNLLQNGIQKLRKI